MIRIPIYLGLLFHANMPFSPSFEPAYHSCYGPLPEIMLEYPDLPINLHYAAPLLQMITWEYPRTLEILNEGMNTGQFELLGSSYAQNVMYACSDWDNHNHVKWNREVLETIFEGWKPKGFWNPERVWKDEFAELIISNFYEYTLVENTILARSINKCSTNRVWLKKIVTPTGKKGLYLFPDNQELLRYVDSVIWTGKENELTKFLEYHIDSDRESSHVFCYAQDMEASGFWQLGRGLTYQKAHRNLRKLFTILQDNDWIQVKLFSKSYNHT